MRTKKILIGSGTIIKDFSTADDLLERRRNLLKCSTGSSRLDSFLKGGIETQAMTEIAGEYASGKTQLCYTLCVTVTLPLNKGGLDGSVIFVDTENTFRSEPVHQIAENRGMNHDKILQKIFVCKVLNAEQLELVAQNLGKSIQEYNAKLVIVDSIISLHRAEFTGRETLAERQKRLNIMLNKLLRLAEVHNVAIVLKEVLNVICKACAKNKVALVCTSNANVTSKGIIARPIGGTFLKHIVNTIVNLKENQYSTFKATLVKHQYVKTPKSAVLYTKKVGKIHLLI